MLVNVRVVTPAKTEKNATVVCNRLRKVIPVGEPVLAPYHKGGYQAVMSREIEDGAWADSVLEIIAIAQSFGHGWEINGAIEEEITLTTLGLSISGLQFCQIHLSKTEDGFANVHYLK